MNVVSFLESRWTRSLFLPRQARHVASYRGQRIVVLGISSGPFREYYFRKDQFFPQTPVPFFQQRIMLLPLGDLYLQRGGDF